MVRKGFNWRARQVKETTVDNSETKNISLDFQSNGKYDKSNELVLPSQKRKTKVKERNLKIVKILSKKHRKRLENILDKKLKKDNRTNLLEELQKVRLDDEERKKLIKLSEIQTKGLKKLKNKEKKREIFEIQTENEKEEDEVDVKKLKFEDAQKIQGSLNIIGFDESSEDEKEIEENFQEKQEENSGHSVKIPEQMVETPEKTVEISVKLPEQLSKPSTFIPVHRSKKIRESREKLPIISMEQEIVELISANAIVIISGETGSGKTTQIPQFLYESGYCNSDRRICVTEPRRIAAISMSKRVAEEMNLTDKEVSYLVRFEGNFNENTTKILFVTDGVLLKEVKNDFLLKNYSVVILDEAHERSMFTDILIGLLSRIVKLREKKGDPLKLIIMSATLKLEDFTQNQRLFKIPPPSLNIETRQFPVTIHFNKTTYENYLEECLKKISKIHKNLPEGGILCFVTGQQEVNFLVKKLRSKFPLNGGQFVRNFEKKIERGKIKLPDIKLDDYSLPNDSEIFAEEEEDILEKEVNLEENEEESNQPLWTLPLYSLLPVEKQNRIFQKIPEGCRLCVISTNVAETSLTIPGIKYVVDSGKTKKKFYDKITGVSSYAVTWTSKASADQRAGRAGRCGPGHCYRLYSSAVFNDIFEEFPEPEICRAPSDDLYLRMRSMNIEKIVNFPFPTAPDLLQLKSAENRLQILEIVDENSRITPLGRAVVKFPVLPRYGKMLALSHQYDILQYTICLVAALSVPEILIENPGENSGQNREKWAQTRLRWAGSGNSYLLGDNMVLLKAVGAAEYAEFQGKLDEFCAENGIRKKAFKEVQKLRKQLSKEILANVENLENFENIQLLKPPDDLKAKLLRQILLAGLGDQIARKVGIDEVPTGEKKSHYKYAYRTNNMEDLIFLNRDTVLKNSLPEFVVYQELYEVEIDKNSSKKIFMRGITAIEPEWLPVYVKKSCRLDAPLEDPEPWLSSDGKIMCNVNGFFGPQSWQLPLLKIEHPKCENLYKFFAKFLLEGEIFEKLRKYSTSLLSRASVMTKKWAKLQTRTRNLLARLMENDVKTRLDLAEIWKNNPTFLLEEYLEWLPQSAHAELTSKWPPL